MDLGTAAAGFYLSNWVPKTAIIKLTETVGKMIWVPAKEGKYMVKSAYNLLTEKVSSNMNTDSVGGEDGEGYFKKLEGDDSFKIQVLGVAGDQQLPSNLASTPKTLCCCNCKLYEL